MALETVVMIPMAAMRLGLVFGLSLWTMGFLKVFQIRSDPKHPKFFILMISMILSSFIVGLFHKAMIFQIPINHPWTPKL